MPKSGGAALLQGARDDVVVKRFYDCRSQRRSQIVRKKDLTRRANHGHIFKIARI